MKSFRGDRRGNVAVIFGLMAVPLFGLSGVALDYTRASELRSLLQNKADAVALNAAVAGDQVDHTALIANMKSEVEARYGGNNGLMALSVDGSWINGGGAFRVTATGQVDTALVHVLPGINRGMDIGIEAVAGVEQEPPQYEPPEAFELEPEAGDYNEIYAYCFDYERDGPNHSRRSQMTLIADNDGNEYNYEWPRCGKGESLSFRMRNVRHARAHPELWQNRNQPPYGAEYDFYTDTAIVNGVERIDVHREVAWIPQAWKEHHHSGRYSGGGFEVLEKIRCESLEECRGESKGGIIPEGRHRTPEMTDKPCEPGKYMYFGWEDRPTGQPGPNGTWTDPAWTDADFDDIRIVMKCPDSGGLGDRVVRLIK